MWPTQWYVVVRYICVCIVGWFQATVLVVLIWRPDYLQIKRLCGEKPFYSEDKEALYKQIFKGFYNKESVNYQSLSVNAKVDEDPLFLYSDFLAF